MKLTSLEDNGWVKGAPEGVVISLIRSMVLTISLLVWNWKVNWNSEFILLCWLWLNVNGHIWQVRLSLMATVPPPQIPPGPSCWPLRWQWLGLGSAGGICQGWPANKCHHLEGAEEEKRISKKHLHAVKSFLVRSLNGTGHHFFPFIVATNWLLRNHPVMGTSALISSQPHFKQILKQPPIFFSLVHLNSSPVSSNLTPPLSLSADDLASYFEKTEAIRPELIQLRAHTPTFIFFNSIYITVENMFPLLPKLNAHTECEILPSLHSQGPSSVFPPL